VGDGYADTERFLDDGPQVRQVLQDGEVVHGIRACGEGCGEFQFQKPEAAGVGEKFVGGDGDGPGCAEGRGHNEHLSVLLETIERFFLGG